MHFVLWSISCPWLLWRPLGKILTGIGILFFLTLLHLLCSSSSFSSALLCQEDGISKFSPPDIQCISMSSFVDDICKLNFLLPFHSAYAWLPIFGILSIPYWSRLRQACFSCFIQKWDVVLSSSLTLWFCLFLRSLKLSCYWLMTLLSMVESERVIGLNCFQQSKKSRNYWRQNAWTWLLKLLIITGILCSNVF